MSYHYFGLIATVLLLIGLVFVVWRWPQDRHKTFSQHVALRRSSVVYYSLLFAVTLPILLTFFIGWFTPTFGITRWLNMFVGLAAFFQLACTFVPEVGGLKTSWHRALAGVSALFLLPALILLLAYSSVSVMAKGIVVASLATMACCMFLVAAAKGAPRNFLIIQSVYFAAFFVPVLYISYLQ